MADQDKVRVEYPEGDYSDDIKRADERMVGSARRMRDSSGFWSRGFAPEMYEGAKRDMQSAAEEGMRLRRNRKNLRELGEKLRTAGSGRKKGR
jgi:hypothetical protein